ncbi:MAG TPA: tetratricopeptide repeat protein [Terriglobales bacterium]
MKALRLLLFLASLSLSASSSDAYTLLTDGQANRALATLNQQVAANPRDARAHNLLCRVFYQEERWDNAISECERAVALDPRNSSYQLWLGRAYGQKADHSSFVTAAGLASKVRTAFEKAVQLDAKNVEARCDLSEFYIEAPPFMGGGSDKAVTQAEALTQYDPAAAHWLRARVAEHRKQMDVAESEYKKAVEADRDRAERLFDLASFYRRTGRLNDMEVTVSRLSADPPQNGAALFDAASLLLRSGRNFPAAIDLFRRYLASNTKGELGPAFQAYYRLGVLLEKTGDAAGAADAHRKALELASDYAPAQTALRRLQNGRVQNGN